MHSHSASQRKRATLAGSRTAYQTKAACSVRSLVATHAHRQKEEDEDEDASYALSLAVEDEGAERMRSYLHLLSLLLPSALTCQEPPQQALWSTETDRSTVSSDAFRRRLNVCPLRCTAALAPPPARCRVPNSFAPPCARRATQEEWARSTERWIMQPFRSEDARASKETLCMICGTAHSDEGDPLLVCDGRQRKRHGRQRKGALCNQLCHLSCAGLDSVPDGRWLCSGCASARPTRQRSA